MLGLDGGRKSTRCNDREDEVKKMQCQEEKIKADEVQANARRYRDQFDAKRCINLGIFPPLASIFRL